jgi:hypothetical protein
MDLKEVPAKPFSANISTAILSSCSLVVSAERMFKY